MADCFEKVLMDAPTNLYVEDYQITSENFPGSEGPSWRIRKFVLRGGKQDGVDVVEIDNGYLTVVVVPTRGMAVLEACTDEVSLGWNSPVRQIVHPAYVDEESRGGLGWLEGFNEFVCRCGLAYHGAPGEDVVRTNTGAEETVSLPLHGTVANCPAARLRVRVQVRPPYELSLVGEVFDTQMFGAAYRLVSTVSTRPGSGEFTIADEVCNLGGMPAELEMLYHCNYGPPLLGEGATLVAPVRYACARDERALEGIGSWDTYGPPQAGFAEQCYFLRTHADDNGRSMVALVDPDQRLAGTIRYSTGQLPALTVWKNTASERDGYVTGLEPGTDYPNSRRFERSKGRVVELPPDATLSTMLEFGVVCGPDRVAAVREEIASLAEGKESNVSQTLDPEYSPS